MKKFIAGALCALTLAGAGFAQNWRRDTRIRSLTRELAGATSALQERGPGIADRLDEEAERLHSRARDLESGRIDRSERGDRFARERMDRTDRRERELAFIEQFRTVERIAKRIDRRFDRGERGRGAERIFRTEVQPILTQLRAELPTLHAWRNFDDRRNFDQERM